MSRRQRPNELVEIERNLCQSAAVVRQFGHVAGLCPALLRPPHFLIARIIVEKRIKTATRYDDRNAFIKHRREDGVVAAQRMADSAKPTMLYERQRVQQIESANVVPNRLQSPALPAERFQLGLIFGQKRIAGSKNHISTVREFGAILPAGLAA